MPAACWPLAISEAKLPVGIWIGEGAIARGARGTAGRLGKRKRGEAVMTDGAEEGGGGSLRGRRQEVGPMWRRCALSKGQLAVRFWRLLPALCRREEGRERGGGGGGRRKLRKEGGRGRKRRGPGRTRVGLSSSRNASADRDPASWWASNAWPLTSASPMKELGVLILYRCRWKGREAGRGKPIGSRGKKKQEKKIEEVMRA